MVTPGSARLARSLADTRSIVEQLAQRRACVSLAGHLHDPAVVSAPVSHTASRAADRSGD
ncbi:hypothetical protein [Actinoplanes sp. SE50/110]|uniref:hypothetical protein n=1 Tax=unclassified Actinoplanes TaxID=2626549 RepID=UPI00351010B9